MHTEFSVEIQIHNKPQNWRWANTGLRPKEAKMCVSFTKVLQTLMSGVRPKKNPNMYAMMSLQITQEIGTMNLDGRKIKPLKVPRSDNSKT